MNTAEAIELGRQNRGKPSMVFDWAKAARLITERQPRTARAGLRGDWEFTGGMIWEGGEIIDDEYTYLASTWAVPELKLDSEIIDCYIMDNETEWDCETKWPDEARAILSLNYRSTR